jgi:TonB-linked SusC/RagA family outer membrane protein
MFLRLILTKKDTWRKIFCILCICGCCSIAFAQTRVSGKVVDVDDISVIGASVREKGTSNGVVTDSKGNFSISVHDNSAVLQVSYVGYVAQEITVGDRTELNITLEEDGQALDEVVVVGYGTQKKINLTGSVASVGDAELTKRPTPNVQNLLQGKISGVQISQKGGQPGNDQGNIRIRGVGTFSSAGSNPLVLVDGVQGDISDVDPNDVESVSVLKDAASAAIYGARAANGVILITTKRGRTGDVSFEYHVTLEAQKATRLPELLTNSADYMMYWNEANERAGMPKYFSQEEIDAFRNNPNDPVNYPNFDWIDYLINTAFTHNHHLGINGGTDKINFNLSVGYLDQGGIVDYYTYKRYNIRLALESKITNWLTIGGNIQAMRKDVTNDVQGALADHYPIMHIFGCGPNYTPTMTLPDGSTGYVARYSANIGEWTVRNPVSLYNAGSNLTNNYTVRPQLYLELKLLDGLTWYTKGAVDFDYYFRKLHEHPIDNYYFNDGTWSHDGAVSNLGVRDWMNNTLYTALYSTLNYQKTFNDDHNLNLMAGYNQESSYYRELYGSRMYFPTDDLKELNAGSALNQSTSGTANEWAIQSLFGRINYDYKGKYLFEANIRYDGTSRIAPDTRWGLFPSMSAAWRMSEEAFMEDLEWLDNLKLRASWGKLGNQNVGNYPYQDVLSSTSYPFASLESGVQLTRLVDRTLQWEMTTNTEFGVEFSLLKGLFSLGAVRYNKFTDGILYNIPIPASVGLSAPTINGGQMRNIGWDFDIGHRHNFGEVRYNVSFNFSTYTNEVIKIISPSYGTTTVQEGLPYGSFYMVEWTGIFQNQAEIDNGPTHPYGPKPGDLKFKDQNNDGVINGDDRIVMDGAFPKFYYGGSLNVFWRNLDVSLFIQGVEGVKNYIDTGSPGFFPYRQGGAPTMDFVRNHWTGEGSTNSEPAMYRASYNPVLGTVNSYFLRDASYLRLKNLRIGYNFPSTIVRKLKMKGLQIYVSGDNMITITKYPGMDPERAYSAGSFSSFPQLATYAFGLKVKF